MAVALRMAVAARIGPTKASGIIRLAKAVAPLKAGRIDGDSGEVRSRLERHLTDAVGICDACGCVSPELVGNVMRAGVLLQKHFVWPDHGRQMAAQPHGAADASSGTRTCLDPQKPPKVPPSPLNHVFGA
jgi:hypothetical protein